MPASPKPAQLVHIPVAAAGATLSKAQKEFNRLTKRVTKLEKDLVDFRTAAEELNRRIQAEYRPLQQQHDEQRAALVVLLDEYYRRPGKHLTAAERRKTADLLGEAFFDLLDKGFDHLKPILDAYTPGGTEQANAEADQMTADLMRQMFEVQYGIQFDPTVDISSPAKFQAYAQQLLAEQEAIWQAEEEAAAARRATRKKSAKQLAAEQRKAEEEKATTQTVRTIYRDLVKALHPDREPDPAEKARKTELLQRVTAAYERNELLTLLRLQLELERLDPAHLENLADAQLAPYNRLLREQVRELEQSLFEEQMAASQFSGSGLGLSAQGLRNTFQWQKADLQRRLDLLAVDVAAIREDVGALKQFLKITSQRR